MKLSTKFLVPTVLLISIGMGILTLISFVYSRNAIEESVAAQMEQLLNSTIDNYANWVEARRADLDTWSQQEVCIAALEQSFIGISASKSFTQDLIKLKARHGYYHDIFLVDRNGTVITASMPEKIGKHNIADADYFVRALEGVLTISPVYRDIISGKPVFVMAMPVRVNGEIKGQLCMEFDLIALNKKSIDKIKIGQSGKAFIVDNRDGRILAHPDPSRILKANIINDALGREIFKSEKGQLQTASPLGTNQREQLVVYDVLKELNWKIAIGADIEELSAPIIRIRNINFIITITIICVACLIIVLLTRTTIIRPIQRLQTSAEHLSLGSLDHPIYAGRNDELGSLARSFAVMRDAIKLQMRELQTAEAATKESHERLLTVLNGLSAIVYVTDMKTYEVLFINKFTHDIFGNIEGKLCWQTMQTGQTGPCSFCTNDKLLNSDGTSSGVYSWEFKNTFNNKWYYIQDRAIQWVDGRIVRMEIATDITDRKIAEEKTKASLREKEVLLREIHHRTKNNMQVISSLISLQADQIEDKQYIDKFNDTKNRIKSMALVHEKLYKSKDISSIDFKDYIKTLASNLIHFYGTSAKKISLKTNIEDIEVGIDTAIPCGLVINELISNCLKHAFPEDRTGTITVIFNKNKIEDDLEYNMIVSDNGIGIPEDLDIRKTKSLGLQLVMTLIEHQLGGMVELDRTKGTEFRIKFREPLYKQRV